MNTAVSVDDQLAESFKQLVKKRPIEKITIKEITSLAGVIRPTFYNHFQDKYELLEWIIRRDVVTPIYPMIGKSTSDEALKSIFYALLEDSEFYMKARRLEGQNSFESIVLKCMTDALNRAADEYGSHDGVLEELPVSDMINYYARSMSIIILNWIDEGMKRSPEDVVRLYRFVKDHSFEVMLKQLQTGETGSSWRREQ